MTDPSPLTLAQEIAPSLAQLQWGIGGSLLLWRLGLEPKPRDLDIMTTAEHFPAINDVFARRLGAGVRTPHPNFRSVHFAKFESDGAVAVDLFAEVRVKKPDQVVSWNFDPQRIEVWRDLPWMLPKDWLELYTLFD